MDGVTSYREGNRARLRQSLISAARELTVQRGWAGVRMADVAAAAGVSRQTVYNEFDGRSGLADALATREIEFFVAEVRRQLAAHGGEIRAGAYAAILHTLREAEGNPIVRAVLTGAGAEDLLPYLTTRADTVLALAGSVIRDWLGGHLAGGGGPEADVAVDAIVRLTVSHIVLPSAPAAATAGVLADVFTRLLPVGGAPDAASPGGAGRT